MIDQTAVTALIQQQIADVVRGQMTEILADPIWIDQLQTRAVEMLSDKLETRFNRINDDADLNRAVQDGIKSIFEHGFVPDITRYVDSTRFHSAVQQGINTAVQAVIDNLSLDPLWLSRVEAMVTQQMHIKVNRYISELDIAGTVTENITPALDRWLEANPQVRTPGIDDQADKIELTVMSDAVVVEGELIASKILTTGDAQVDGCMTVKDLSVVGSIDVTEAAWNQIGARASALALSELTQEWRQSLVKEIADQIANHGIDLQKATVGGQPLLTDGRFSDSIHHSNLRSVGVLDKLDVAGTVDVKGRITVSEKDTMISIGALDQDRAWIGVPDGKELTLGSREHPQISLEANGVTAIDQLKLNGSRLGFAAQVPGYRGQRGDIVFNSDPSPGSPFAWVCLGAFSWQGLKAA